MAFMTSFFTASFCPACVLAFDFENLRSHFHCWRVKWITPFSSTLRRFGFGKSCMFSPSQKNERLSALSHHSHCISVYLTLDFSKLRNPNPAGVACRKESQSDSRRSRSFSRTLPLCSNYSINNIDPQMMCGRLWHEIFILRTGIG
jgi:hypothetical protein